MSTTTHAIAFALYLVVFVALLYFALRYLFQNRCMTYHEAAIGRKWESLDPPLQTLLLGMQKNMGAGMLTAIVAGLFLLFEPFRRGELWASWGLMATLTAFGVPTLYATIFINRRTGANTPVLPTALSMALSFVAFLISLL